MHSFLTFAALAFATGCHNTIPEIKSDDTAGHNLEDTASQTDTETGNTTDTDMVDTDTAPIDTGDTGATEEDPCDLSFRTYTEDGHYVDVTVGAMPFIQATSGSETVESDTYAFSGIFEVTSKQGCGQVEIFGIQILIERSDGAEIPKSESNNELLDYTSGISSFAATNWYGNTSSSDTAPMIGMDWNSEIVDDSIGSFESYILEANESREYLVRPEILRQVPAGEYVVTYALMWRDVETSTTVWGANIDNAQWRVTVL